MLWKLGQPIRKTWADLHKCIYKFEKDTEIHTHWRLGFSWNGAFVNFSALKNKKQLHLKKQTVRWWCSAANSSRPLMKWLELWQRPDLAVWQTLLESVSHPSQLRQAQDQQQMANCIPDVKCATGPRVLLCWLYILTYRTSISRMYINVR